MSDFKCIPEFNIPFQIVSYATSKSVRLYMKDGYIKITKPVWYSESKVFEHIKKDKENIITEYEKYMNSLKQHSLLQQDYLYLLGNKCNLEIIYHDSDNCEIDVSDNKVTMHLPNDTNIEQREFIASKLVNEIYKNHTSVLVAEALKKYCDIMKLNLPQFRIGSYKTKWGSCDSKGKLCFHLKLAMLPPRIIEHVVIHELCHLKYMNHGGDFWKSVYSYCSKEEYELGKKWIKDHINFLLL